MTIVFKEYENYKPDINKIEEKIDVATSNSKDNCFHSFGFNYVCDVKFSDFEIIKLIKN